MKDTEKQAIADLLKAYCDLKGSQNKAAASLRKRRYNLANLQRELGVNHRGDVA